MPTTPAQSEDEPESTRSGLLGLVGIDRVLRMLVRFAGAVVNDQVNGLVRVVPLVMVTPLTMTV